MGWIDLIDKAIILDSVNLMESFIAASRIASSINVGSLSSSSSIWPKEFFSPVLIL